MNGGEMKIDTAIYPINLITTDSREIIHNTPHILMGKKIWFDRSYRTIVGDYV